MTREETLINEVRDKIAQLHGYENYDHYMSFYNTRDKFDVLITYDYANRRVQEYQKWLIEGGYYYDYTDQIYYSFYESINCISEAEMLELFNKYMEETV